eukprot:COSAG01_NODE_14340_length_1466_cov_1.743965_1_plen_303_part_00
MYSLYYSCTAVLVLVPGTYSRTAVLYCSLVHVGALGVYPVQSSTYIVLVPGTYSRTAVCSLVHVGALGVLGTFGKSQTNEGKVKNGEYYALFAAASGKKEVLLGDTTFFVRFQDEGKLPVSMSMSVRSRCALAWIGKDSGEVKRERDSPQPLSSKRRRGRQQSASASVSVSAADLKCPVDDSIKLCERNIVAVHDQLRELHGHRKRAFPLFHSLCHSPCHSPFVNPFLSLCLAVLLDMRKMFYKGKNCATPAWVADTRFKSGVKSGFKSGFKSGGKDEEKDEVGDMGKDEEKHVGLLVNPRL